VLPTVNELREESRRYLEAARLAEGDDTKRQLAAYALAIAQIAEALERDSGRLPEATAERYERLLDRALGESARKTVGELLRRRSAAAVGREQIRRWRTQAEELRTAADQFVNPMARESLRSAAATYEQIADNAEARLNGKPDGATGKTG
jgi:hypothetical protein